MWVFFISFVYTGLIVWTFLQSQKLNLTYYFKSYSYLITYSYLLILTKRRISFAFIRNVQIL